MSQQFLKLIQTGATAEIAAAAEADPTIIGARDSQGVSMLLWSVYAGQPLVRDYLLAQLATHGVLLDVFEAAAVGDVLRIEDLLAADPATAHSYSGDGWTPLHLAAGFGTPQSVDVLLQHGAQVDAVSRNPQRNQPLHAALALGRNTETVRLLLAHGADPNALQVGGFTPLFSAATANRRDLAEMLIESGAHALHRSDLGKTAADFARERGHAALADWLESQPA
ncbi:MAG TPA: ankyrin repeat domain-containing protein [Terracidiphilus sp.]